MNTQTNEKLFVEICEAVMFYNKMIEDLQSVGFSIDSSLINSLSTRIDDTIKKLNALYGKPISDNFDYTDLDLWVEAILMGERFKVTIDGVEKDLTEPEDLYEFITYKEEENENLR